ncbi:MAG TPA: trypsin-like peptidase domain-containing protein [Gemmataceae bacterium]|nr:trypsin-like peptidase domain-containing protein [Gemmataceae bacterium]
MTFRAKLFSHYAVVLLTVAVGLCGTTTTYGQRAPRESIPTKTDERFLAAFREVVAIPSRSTVRVRCDETVVAFGAVVGEDGWVLTKASQLQGSIVCEIHDGRELPARIVGVSKPYDLAMLKLEVKGLKPVEWRDSTQDAVGSWVATPGMNRDPVAVGILSVGAREIKGPELARRGSSGGFLGIIIDRRPNKEGVKIEEVIPGGAADKAEFQDGDIIVAVGKTRVTDPETLFNALETTKPGQKVKVRVKRGSEEMGLEARLGSRPTDRADFQNKLGSELSHRRTGFPMVLQHDTVLRPVDCGGPLVDLDGKVIGINIARSGRTETFAIPAEAVKPLLGDLKSGKLAPPK